MWIGRGLVAWWLCASVWMLAGLAEAECSPPWQEQVRMLASQHRLDEALHCVEGQLHAAPSDLEAHGWRGRILAWEGRWPDAESEYRLVLERAPADVDILTALADVLVWQGRAREALPLVDRARLLTPSDPEVLWRRAKILLLLGDIAEARDGLRQTLVADPANQQARSALLGLTPEARYELRIGVDVDTFDYTDPSQVQSVSLNSRWSRRWSSQMAISTHQRFGEHATKGTASATLRMDHANWLTAGGAGADDHGIVPYSEAFFEYGHGFRLHRIHLVGLDFSYHQHWLWYQQVHVLTTGVTGLLYLPRDWTWSVTTGGIRSGFPQAGVEWAPSGSTKISFPVVARVTGHIFFAVGSEDFAQVARIGRFAARTWGGGLRYRITPNQDLSGYVAAQDRSQGRSQNSYGLSYGVHF